MSVLWVGIGLEIAGVEVWRVDPIVVDPVGYGPEQGCVVVVVKSYGKTVCEASETGDGPTFGPAILATEQIIHRQRILVARHKIVTHIESRKAPA